MNIRRLLCVLATAGALWAGSAGAAELPDCVAVFAEAPQSPMAKPLPPCLEAHAAVLAELKRIAAQYWDMPDYAGRYAMFSTRLRAELANRNIRDGTDYVNGMLPPEETTSFHAIQRIRLTGNSARITVLTRWFDEGYGGLQTVVLRMTRENGWKIDRVIE